VELEGIDHKLVDMLELFSPFGPQNLRPVFITKSLEVFGEPYIVGNNHLRFKVKKNDKVFDAIGFGLGDWAKPLSMKKIKIDLVYVVGKNEWNDSIQLQLQVRDLRITEI
jgi:single-stranded-DNA-specific exonuclease